MDFILSYLAVILLFAILVLSTGIAIVWAMFLFFNRASNNLSHDILDSEHHDH